MSFSPCKFALTLTLSVLMVLLEANHRYRDPDSVHSSLIDDTETCHAILSSMLDTASRVTETPALYEIRDGIVMINYASLALLEQMLEASRIAKGKQDILGLSLMLSC